MERIYTRKAAKGQRGFRCYRCKETLTRKSFNRNRTKPNGLHDICKDCRSERRVARRHIKNEAARRRKRRSDSGFRQPGPKHLIEFRVRQFRETGVYVPFGAKAAGARLKQAKKLGLDKMYTMPITGGDDAA